MMAYKGEYLCWLYMPVKAYQQGVMYIDCVYVHIAQYTASVFT